MYNLREEIKSLSTELFASSIAHQKDFNTSHQIHCGGDSVRQIEQNADRTAELGPQIAWNHEVGAPALHHPIGGHRRHTDASQKGLQ